MPLSEHDEAVLMAYAELGRTFADLVVIAGKRAGGVHLVVHSGLSEPVVIDNVSDVYAYMPQPTELQPLQGIVRTMAHQPMVSPLSPEWDHELAYIAWQHARAHTLRSEQLLIRLLTTHLADALPPSNELD